MRDSVPRLKYGRENLQGTAVGRSSVDGALIAHGGARARYLLLAFLVNNDGDSVPLFSESRTICFSTSENFCLTDAACE